MGLPDTLKAKKLFENRKKLIKKAFDQYDAKNNSELFNFDEILHTSKKDVGKSWKSLAEKDPEANKNFPIIDNKKVEDLRAEINKDLNLFMVENYPSLKKDL